ncbi:hypothetical protein L198_06743 [Cryptococcus wingfieldii CBS 7118]|uniref:Uncharacterized protein n=1 Tax=Cryptococcus wingfieldii CBS 7118 TaxID=1295528 RepID=A0A1E3IL87_9TREE|nr:hypothetical protein L198_06743 [Cryptococcus wingfieldii CBS 7118]ODN88471.1 hypothetical protein L198_06743 [Cryptococcus wingfieldii CBS 7118]
MLSHLRRALSRHHDDLLQPSYQLDLASSYSPSPSFQDRSRTGHGRSRITPFPPGRFSTPSPGSYHDQVQEFSEGEVERDELQALEALYVADDNTHSHPGEFKTAVRELVRREVEGQRRMWRRTELGLDDELGDELFLFEQSDERDTRDRGEVGEWDGREGYGVESVFATRSSGTSVGSLDGTIASELWRARESLSRSERGVREYPEAPPPYRSHEVSAYSQPLVFQPSPVEGLGVGGAPSYRSAGFALPALRVHGLEEEQQPLSPAPDYISIEGINLPHARHSSNSSRQSQHSSSYPSSSPALTTLSSSSGHSPVEYDRAPTPWFPAVLSSGSSVGSSREGSPGIVGDGYVSETSSGQESPSPRPPSPVSDSHGSG